MTVPHIVSRSCFKKLYFFPKRNRVIVVCAGQTTDAERKKTFSNGKRLGFPENEKGEKTVWRATTRSTFLRPGRLWTSLRCRLLPTRVYLLHLKLHSRYVRQQIYIYQRFFHFSYITRSVSWSPTIFYCVFVDIPPFIWRVLHCEASMRQTIQHCAEGSMSW